MRPWGVGTHALRSVRVDLNQAVPRVFSAHIVSIGRDLRRGLRGGRGETDACVRVFLRGWNATQASRYGYRYALTPWAV